MFDFISLVGQWSLDVLSRGGYPGIFLLSVADRLTFQVIPGEVVFSLLGFLVSQAKFNFVFGLMLTVAGNFFGDAVIYWISLKGGRRFIGRFGKYFLISEHELNHTEEWFKKYGGRIIFWGRFIPVVVTFISIPAGLARMNFGRFSIYTLLGSLPRNFILMFIGFKLGENWSEIVEFLEKSQFVMIILLAAAIIWYVIRHIRQKHLTHESR